MNNLPLRVTVLCGGTSREREVSLSGGAAVAKACLALGHEVSIADINPWDLSALDIPADVVFPVLHGEFGEDGVLQGILEARGLPYVGSGPESSRRTMDKIATKHAWVLAGLPTPPWAEVCADTITSVSLAFEPPVVVKPACQGSSIGVAFVESLEELQVAVNEGVRLWGSLLVEPRLRGRELTVGILGNRALPVIEVRTSRVFYDYDAKYRDTDTVYDFDTGLSDREAIHIQELALKAFEVLGCRDLGRVDLIQDINLGPQLLEINSIPGFTDHSLLPKAAAHVGLDLKSIAACLIEMAMERSKQ